MNVYDPTIHGVCGYARPIADERDAARAGRATCACGLEVRLDESTGLWMHYVEGAPTRRTQPVLAGELAERIQIARDSYALFVSDWRELGKLVREVDEDRADWIDAYCGWDLGKLDIGARRSITGWLDELEDEVNGFDDEDALVDSAAVR